MSTQPDPVDAGRDRGTSTRTGPRRRGLVLGGLALVLVGLSMLGYVGWQYWGTNIVAKQQQAAVTDNLVSSWKAPGPRRKTPAEGPKANSLEIGEPLGLVRIPEFGRDFVVPVLNGIRPTDLAKGIGHYPGTALPGQIGNFAVAGHRVTNGEPFRHVPSLRPGDVVTVETSDSVYTYELTTNPNKLIVQPDDTWVLDPIPGKPRKTPPNRARITLTTCADLYHSPDRMIVFGKLVDTERKRS